MKGGAIATIAIALALARTDAARADVCPPEGMSWLRVAFAGDGFTPALRTRVLEQLGAEFQGHGLALCDATVASAPPPLADIVLTLSPEAVLSLEVRDAVTYKRVTRELPLGSVPRDALALSVTLAAEELVHASWIEAALAPQPSPAAPAIPQPLPEPVRHVNAEEMARMPEAPRPRRPWFAEAAAMGAVHCAAGGQTDIGGVVRFPNGGRQANSALAGLLFAPYVETAHGTVSGRELLAGLGVAYSFVPRDAPWGGDLGARAELIDVQFSGTATPGDSAIVQAHGTRLGAIMSGTLGGWVRVVGPWRIVGDAAVGAPILGVTATDANDTATGVSGVTLGFAVGVAATLPD